MRQRRFCSGPFAKNSFRAPWENTARAPFRRVQDRIGDMPQKFELYEDLTA